MNNSSIKYVPWHRDEKTKVIISLEIMFNQVQVQIKQRTAIVSNKRVHGHLYACDNIDIFSPEVNKNRHIAHNNDTLHINVRQAYTLELTYR